MSFSHKLVLFVAILAANALPAFGSSIAVDISKAASSDARGSANAELIGPSTSFSIPEIGADYATLLDDCLAASSVLAVSIDSIDVYAGSIASLADFAAVPSAFATTFDAATGGLEVSAQEHLDLSNSSSLSIAALLAASSSRGPLTPSAGGGADTERGRFSINGVRLSGALFVPEPSSMALLNRQALSLAAGD
jgi:hypothetical protein